MPELPEVETMRRGILPIVDATIVDVQFPTSRFKPIAIAPSPVIFRQHVKNRPIVRVDRLGKRLILKLDREDSIVIEPRMTGLMLLTDAPDADHVRVQWHLNRQSTPVCTFWDRRGLGTVRLLDSMEFQRALGGEKIGPDALTVDSNTLRARLHRSRREIKVALLDQRAVAGIGNLYAAEILHIAALNPRKSCCRLTGRDWKVLAEATRLVLAQAVRYEGSTLADGTYRNALNVQGSYQNHHRVYARTGQPCKRCETGRIERFVQAQRATFWCPLCQRR